MLPTNEWLSDAKRIAVGSTNRVYHGAERRPNLVVRNLQDRYTAYCHSCKEGGVVMKDVVRVTANEFKTTPLSTNPGLLLRIDLESLNVPVPKIVEFLHSKDMSLFTLQAQAPMWSAKDQRIVFCTPDQVLGRDITGKSPAKWHMYRGAHNYARAKDVSLEDKVVVLTEDFFSAAKGQHYCPDYVFVALVGTVLHPDLAVELMKAKHVILCLDGDDAGWHGATSIARKLNLLGIPYELRFPPAGKDPKNMDASWWENVFPNLE